MVELPVAREGRQKVLEKRVNSDKTSGNREAFTHLGRARKGAGPGGGDLGILRIFDRVSAERGPSKRCRIEQDRLRS
jgi:hypothetical protein